MDFWIQSWNQRTKFRVAHEHLTVPEESKNELIKNQTHANLFFLTVKVLFIRNSCLKDKQLINSTIVRSLNDAEKGFMSSQRLCTLGCCITLPSPWTNFWPKTVFQWFCSPPTHLIWIRVTYSFSWNSNSTSKVIILKLWTTSKRLWQTSQWHFHMKTSSTATRNGSNISSSVWLPKGTTLKGMMICSSVVNKKFYSTSLITF